ncbi:hypothetical protein ACFYZH_10105 [Streptomyces abikoensis]|uniref:hypothetical protein n=1 Tax=Streptomyces abikoensis TaxID=97398 RepID=UPI003674D5EA
MGNSKMVAEKYESMLTLNPTLVRILGGMESAAGMLMLFKHDGGEHVVHYYCSRTEERQYRKFREKVPAGFRLVDSMPLKGYEYAPEDGGERFVDVYWRSETS